MQGEISYIYFWIPNKFPISNKNSFYITINIWDIIFIENMTDDVIRSLLQSHMDIWSCSRFSFVSRRKTRWASQRFVPLEMLISSQGFTWASSLLALGWDFDDLQRRNFAEIPQVGNLLGPFVGGALFEWSGFDKRVPFLVVMVVLFLDGVARAFLKGNLLV